MLTVHGSFVPFGTGGFFFVWALDRDTDPTAAKWRALSRHPQAVEVEALYPLIRGLPYANAVACVVFMPGPGGLVPVKVPGLALSVAAGTQWLLDLDTALPGTGFQAGPDLRAWSAAAKLQMELLARGRFLPILRVEAGCLTAEWRLAAPEPADAQRLARLEAALPDLCRAVVPPDRKHRDYQAPSAGALLGLYFRAATGALARRFLAGAEMPVPQPVAPSAAHHWVRALVGAGPADLPPGLPDAQMLYAAVEAWAAPAIGERGHGLLRTGLRLHPPDETDHGGWEVELILQTDTDPPMTLPAGAAWAAIGQGVELAGQRYVNAEQRLLADLPALARLFPPLEPLLAAAAPARLPVDLAAVAHLLAEAAPLLQAAGYPLLLPARLVRGDALRARVHLRPAGPAGGTGAFGLSQLVQVDWELALGGLPISYDELQRLAREKRPLVQHQGRWVHMDQQVLAAALRHLAAHREQMPLSAALRLAARTAPTAAAVPDGQPEGARSEPQPLQVEEVTADGWMAELLGRLAEPARIEPVPVPAGFQGTLRPYQRRGLDWLAFLHRYGLGACLADDMGLGKTIQVIALLLHERAQGWTDRPALIVCPVSLVGNWRRELARFAPSLRVMVHHGSGRIGADGFAEAARGHDVVITTYSLLPRDEAQLTAVTWAGLIADEAQNVKNAATQHAQVLRRLTADYRIALTGTPVENHLGDLWSIFAFLNPGLLGGQEEFRRDYAVPIERYRDSAATARLQRLVQPFVLRRLKTDPQIAADLPEKLESTVYVTLTAEQAALYEAVVQETLERAAQTEGIQRHGAVLAGLTRLKQVCNHPAHLLDDDGLVAGRSGKLDRLAEMLDEVVARGDRALIFTQFAQFGARLRQYLARRLGCQVLLLDGSTPQPERDRLVARFQSGAAPLFILSLRAGGLGLNLTAANHVFHFDRWWNPAVEDQATDRAYRIGQTQRVIVHKLVTAGTLEERIDRLLADKRWLSAQVIGAGESWLGQLSTAELKELIQLERE